jgi:hypothetical protein
MRASVLMFIVSLLSIVSSARAAAPTPDLETLWKVVQEQQETIASLNQKLDQTLALLNQTQTKLAGTEAAVAQNTQRIEATADAVDAQADTPRSSAVSWADRTQIGGYGELHYNKLDDDATAADGAEDDLSRTDFHRFVLFFNHDFNDWLRFGSELEIEHALVSSDADDPGEVELEQAWIELDLPRAQRLRAGVDILPIGLINPTHEPNTFYGVERNRVESEIIPTTWWEAGVGLSGSVVPGLGYDLVAHSGLVIPTAGGSAFRPRAGRRKVAEADDQDIAMTGRLRYAGIAGLELALSGQYQADYTGTDDTAQASAYLIETHLDYKHKSGLGLRALYARWHFGDDASAGLDPDLRDAENLSGWYIEPAYRFSLRGFIPGEAGIFSRYSQWDERDQLGIAFREFERFDVGLNYWPNPQVVFKVDAQWEDADAMVDRELDGFNLGLGYQF